MKFFKALLSAAVTIVLIWALQTKFSDVPPLAKLLNPATGFWQNAETKDITGGELKLPGLAATVTVKFDDRRIPHIFAANDHDLYYTQGYLTARDRLWQMDIQTRKAAGRLSEVIGEKTLETDRYNRRMGMGFGAENTLKAIMKDPVMREVILAYTEGVNAYISQLSPKDYPVEFKLLDYKPELWQPINCAYLLKLMSQNLAGGSDQMAMNNTLNKIGRADMDDLFPNRPYFDEPIIPAGTKWNFTPLTIPKAPENAIASSTNKPQPQQRREGIGSNNWAISGSRSASGYPILANDPHLDLTYPSIWYQVQLQSPTVNVYGASLPGAPGVVIGFNQKISWGVTNVDAAVLDWYQIKFNKDKTAYWYSNRWNKVSRRIEKIAVKGQEDIIDTVLYTHHGPVVYETLTKKRKDSPKNVPVGNAMRWVAHDESDEFKAFYLLNRAGNYADYREALKYYAAPAQNFIFADVNNDIAITPNGKLPLKYPAQGKFIMDGSNPANDWQGYIPVEQNPTVKNPALGYVSSANQFPTDKTYPYYINWQFEDYSRGKRINNRLAAMQKATADSLRMLQMDDYSIWAKDVLPAMIAYVDESKLSDKQALVFIEVKKWDKHFAVKSIGATIFNLWWTKFSDMTWNRHFKNDSISLRFPSRDRTKRLLLTEPNSKWFDSKRTPETETAADVVNRAFLAAADQLQREHGDPGKKWQWGRVKPMEVSHMAKLDGFGSGNFASGGTGSTVNALTGGHGPSWRMVVQMGPVVKGYGIVPGGQSGNPGSFYYDDMLAKWKAGELDELLFLQSVDERSVRVKGSLILKKK